jgi:uncharacterized membrane protein
LFKKVDELAILDWFSSFWQKICSGCALSYKHQHVSALHVTCHQGPLFCQAKRCITLAVLLLASQKEEEEEEEEEEACSA